MSQIHGSDTDGWANQAEVTDNNELKTLPSDNGLTIAMGSIVGQTAIHKFGRNDNIGNAAWFEAIWNGGSDYSGFNNTTAQILSIVSSSADDVSGTGDGAHTLTIPRPLDNDYVLCPSIIVELNGTTPIYTSGAYLRVTRAIINTAGVLGHNVGSIVVMPSGAGSINIHISMPSTYNQTMIACDTIPSGTTGYMDSFFASLSGKTNANIVVKLLVRPSGGVFNVKEEFAIAGAGTSYVQRLYKIPKNNLPEKSDIKIMATSDTNSTSVAAGFDIILVDNI